VSYNIERSLRFNSADSAYLNRTPASVGNRKTWTWSAWIKRGKLGAIQVILCSSDSAVRQWFGFNSDDTIVWQHTNSPSISTSAVYRDPSAWYHFTLVWDTTQAQTGLNSSDSRMRIYINGVQQTVTGTMVSQNQDGEINNTTATYHGVLNLYNIYYLDGYMTEINFIDGQALAPSSFGETDTDTGVWKPKAYSGTYGTNGFYLKFADNSGTTAATLGKDSSGNGNNWTPNNFSVTAGAGNDSMVDTPTSYGTDTGAGGEVRGNYCTLNPVWPNTVNVTEANLKLSMATNNRGAVGTMEIPVGMKAYFEATITDPGVYDQWAGIIGPTANVTNFRGDWANSTAYGLTHNNSDLNLAPITAGVIGSSAGTPANGDVYGIAVDRVSHELKAYQNNTLRATISIPSTGTFFPACGVGGGTNSVDFVQINFGQRPFAYTAPSGFKALCTQNLPTPTIGATSSTQANDFMNVVLYTGTGSSQSITGVGFQPDFAWIKSRSATTDHGLYDAVRGVQKQLESNNTNAETTESTGLTAFGSDGFTVGALAQLNTASATYVGWNWKANGAGSSNTSGTIASTVSANTTSGFSIVTYTGTGSNATVGHGLGVAPSMVIVKSRTGTTKSWIVWHTAIANTKFLYLNATDGETTGTAIWNSTSPTPSVFSVGTDSAVNENTKNLVAYCFTSVAGYSAFSSYTGNGSSDGPFVFLGFRPRWVMVKRTDVAAAWPMYNSAINPYNVTDFRLSANEITAEFTSAFKLDLVSNGFKIRSSDTDGNASGGTYIYAAFAESPFKYALAR